MGKVISSLFFLLLCEVLFIIPGGIVEIALTSIFSTLNENIISLIAFMASGVVVVICLKVFFYEIFVRIQHLLQASILKFAFLTTTVIAIGLLYSVIVLFGIKLNLVVHKESSIEDTSNINVLLLFIIAIVVATVEEIVYRGADLSYLSMRLKPWISIILISMIFSLGHMQYTGILSYITAFIFSILVSVIVIKTNTLYGAIGLHCGWNFAFSVHSIHFDLNNKIIPHWGSTFELFEIGILLLSLIAVWFYFDKPLSLKKVQSSG